MVAPNNVEEVFFKKAFLFFGDLNNILHYPIKDLTKESVLFTIFVEIILKGESGCD